MMICVKCLKKESENGRKTCCSCNYLQKKKHNPVRIAYSSLKGHAKERGKVFDLTISEFEIFCVKSDYINKKGIKKNSLHIDRIDENVGYTSDNIQALTNTENVRKYIRFVEMNRDGTKKFTTSVQLNPSNIMHSAPF